MGMDTYSEELESCRSEVELIVRTKMYANIVKRTEDGLMTAPREKIDELFAEQPGYYDEIREIIQKYPNYESEHLAKKIIFESTWLPYTISFECL